MFSYLSYDIEAIENIKFSKPNSEINYEESLSYIPGTSLRGAYIYEFIKENNIEDINIEPYKSKLLLGDINFLNAYPINENKRSFPLPKCFLAKKEDMRNQKDSLDLKIVNGLKENELDIGYKKMRISEFVIDIDKENLKKVNIEKENNLHINKKEETNLLFRYEYISKGQKFRAVVKIKENEIEEFKNLMTDKYLYLGGSKGSGYGRCFISNIKEIKKEIEIEKENIKDIEKSFYILADSDIVYRNKKGRYSTELDSEYIGEALGVEGLKLVDSSIGTVNITNFNNKWNCNTANIIGIEKGSIFKYEIENKIEKEKFEKLMDFGIGERKIDGFGRIKIFKDMNYNKITDKNEKENEKIENKNLNNDIDTYNLILKNIFKNRLDNKLDEEIIKLDRELLNDEEDKEVNTTQIGNWLNFFSNIRNLSKEEAEKEYKKYSDHIINKRSTSYFQTSSLMKSGGNMFKFMEKYIKESDKKKKFLDEHGDELKGIKEIEKYIDEKYVYDFNMHIIIEYFRYKINIRKENE